MGCQNVSATCHPALGRGISAVQGVVPLWDVAFQPCMVSSEGFAVAFQCCKLPSEGSDGYEKRRPENGRRVSLQFQEHFAALAAGHDVETFLEIIESESVRYDRREVEAGYEHLLHLVPCFPHLPPVNAFQREGVENDFAPFHLRGVGQYAEQGYFRAFVHVVYHVVEGCGRARHFQPDIEAADVQLAHGLLDSFAFGSVDHKVGSHAFGYVQPVIVQVCYDDMPCSGKAADGCRHGAYQPCSGDEDVLAEQREGERGVRGVAEGVHDGGNVVGDARVELDDVAFRNAEVFGKRAVALHADPDGVFAHVQLAAAAVAAVAAGYVPFAGDAVADTDVAHAAANIDDFADIFMPDDQGRADVFPRPVVPFVNVQVGAANGYFPDFDQYIVHVRLRNGHVFHPNAGFR